MKVALGCDHAGFILKDVVAACLAQAGHEVLDEGTDSGASCDWPEFAERVGARVSSGEAERGIAICGTGAGMAMAANKLPGVRAALCNDLYTARYSRLHNDANVLTMGARVIGSGVAEEIVRTWMETPFEGGRHARRLEKLAEVESRYGGKDA
jgi:ribose 5-phosphate isomerase B